MEKMITTENVCRIFPVGEGESFYALKNVNVTIPKSGLTILKGRSGSGKTTLLNALSALDRPNEGKIYFGDTEITSLSDRKRDKLRRTQLGYIFQSVALIPMMSAYENVEYALRLAGYKGNKKARVTECLNMVGLGQRMLHMPQELSGGEQQRVAIARAIAHKPSVIFADEPTGELDSVTSLQVIKIFKDLIEQEGVTIVMTTHDPKLMEVGDTVYEIEDGVIINGQ